MHAAILIITLWIAGQDRPLVLATATPNIEVCTAIAPEVLGKVLTSGKFGTIVGSDAGCAEVEGKRNA